MTEQAAAELLLSEDGDDRSDLAEQYELRAEGYDSEASRLEDLAREAGAYPEGW